MTKYTKEKKGHRPAIYRGDRARASRLKMWERLNGEADKNNELMNPYYKGVSEKQKKKVEERLAKKKKEEFEGLSPKQKKKRREMEKRKLEVIQIVEETNRGRVKKRDVKKMVKDRNSSYELQMIRKEKIEEKIYNTLSKRFDKAMEKEKEKNRKIQQRLVDDVQSNFNFQTESKIHRQIRDIALLEATLEVGEVTPHYEQVLAVTSRSKSSLERSWKNKEQILSVAPKFLRTRQKGMALKSIAIMEKILESFGDADFDKISVRDRTKLFNMLSTKAEELMTDKFKDTEKSDKLTLDLVLPSNMKTEELKPKFSFIQAEDIEFEDVEDEE
ncbi:MAG: hypothetical protein U9N34_11165 [Candidatus Cloacimonadota bacterium]|nr:hypothetical protein [Candidatus Cloacimonadota bacterium]